MYSLVRLEMKYIPNLRRKKYYKITKFIVLLPFRATIHYTTVGIRYLISLIRFKRKNKPDIVLANIIAGWTNLVLHNAVSERTAMYRANICAECPSAEFSTAVHTIVVDKKTTQVRGMKCGKCGCPLSAKVRADGDYCPLGKW